VVLYYWISCPEYETVNGVGVIAWWCVIISQIGLLTTANDATDREAGVANVAAATFDHGLSCVAVSASNWDRVISAIRFPYLPPI